MWLLLEVQKDNWTDNLVNVTLGCQISIHNDQRCTISPTDPAPHHDAPFAIWHNLLDTSWCCSLPSPAVDSLSSIGPKQGKPAHVTDDNPLPVTSLPMSYSSGRCQSPPTMFCCQ
ncbi:hypothetical protein BaRGS_00030827 [Batillaria attramentaria]|uniref:Uncharacterized protein n=1 Tax=Batillaria attramentaria TaxID=370345 RepID=A0ABD0JSS5_9CAEN